MSATVLSLGAVRLVWYCFRVFPYCPIYVKLAVRVG